MTIPRLTRLHVEDDSLWQARIAAVLRHLPDVRLGDAVATTAAARERIADCNSRHFSAKAPQPMKLPRRFP